MNRSVDWSLWQSFSAVSEHGSLSAAARHTSLSQPTLGRHIDALEIQLGTRLFERNLKGLSLTETGLRLFEQVKRARESLAEAELQAEGSSTTLSGVVRITASTVTSHYTLPHLLRQLRTEYPSIEIELVPSDSPENLLLRESDIAVRMFRPTQVELITRKIADSAIVAAAHHSYLDRRGTPQTLDDLLEHELIGFDRSDLLLSAARGMGIPLERRNFAVRTDNQTAIWELAKAGLGVCFAQQVIVAQSPGMVRILPQFSVPALEVWLTTHRELFTARRIRAIYDRLGELLGAYYRTRDALDPQTPGS